MSNGGGSVPGGADPDVDGLSDTMSILDLYNHSRSPSLASVDSHSVHALGAGHDNNYILGDNGAGHNDNDGTQNIGLMPGYDRADVQRDDRLSPRGDGQVPDAAQADPGSAVTSGLFSPSAQSGTPTVASFPVLSPVSPSDNAIVQDAFSARQTGSRQRTSSFQGSSHDVPTTKEFATNFPSPRTVLPSAFTETAFVPDLSSLEATSANTSSPKAFSSDSFVPGATSSDALSPTAFSPNTFSHGGSTLDASILLPEKMDRIESRQRTQYDPHMRPRDRSRSHGLTRLSEPHLSSQESDVTTPKAMTFAFPLPPPRPSPSPQPPAPLASSIIVGHVDVDSHVDSPVEPGLTPGAIPVFGIDQPWPAAFHSAVRETDGALTSRDLGRMYCAAGSELLRTPSGLALWMERAMRSDTKARVKTLALRRTRPPSPMAPTWSNALTPELNVPAQLDSDGALYRVSELDAVPQPVSPCTPLGWPVPENSGSPSGVSFSSHSSTGPRRTNYARPDPPIPRLSRPPRQRGQTLPLPQYSPSPSPSPVDSFGLPPRLPTRRRGTHTRAQSSLGPVKRAMEMTRPISPVPRSPRKGKPSLRAVSIAASDPGDKLHSLHTLPSPLSVQFAVPPHRTGSGPGGWRSPLSPSSSALSFPVNPEPALQSFLPYEPLGVPRRVARHPSQGPSIGTPEFDYVDELSVDEVEGEDEGENCGDESDPHEAVVDEIDDEVEEEAGIEGIDSDALERMCDALPSADMGMLADALRRTGDELDAIALYLKERAVAPSAPSGAASVRSGSLKSVPLSTIQSPSQYNQPLSAQRASGVSVGAYAY